MTNETKRVYASLIEKTFKHKTTGRNVIDRYLIFHDGYIIVKISAKDWKNLTTKMNCTTDGRVNVNPECSTVTYFLSM